MRDIVEGERRLHMAGSKAVSPLMRKPTSYLITSKLPSQPAQIASKQQITIRDRDMAVPQSLLGGPVWCRSRTKLLSQ